MPVFRVEKNTNYTTMSNYHLRNQNLTLKAKGLLSLCLSLPESWDYSVRGLVAICKEGKDSIVKTLQELEQCGYLEWHQLRREDGKMGGIEYVIYEMPHAPCAENPDAVKLDTDNSDTAKPDAEKPRPENPPQLNKEQLSKEESNTDSNKRKREKEPRHQHGQYRNEQVVLVLDPGVGPQVLTREEACSLLPSPCEPFGCIEDFVVEGLALYYRPDQVVRLRERLYLVGQAAVCREDEDGKETAKDKVKRLLIRELQSQRHAE